MTRFYLTIVFLLMFGTSKSQTVPYYVPSNGLVGWWSLDGNGKDGSGNDNHGDTTGVKLSLDRFGNYKCLSFNGTSGKVQIPHSKSMNFTKVTISLWVNAESGYSLVNYSNWTNASSERFNFGLGDSILNSSIKINSNCNAGVGWKSQTTKTGSLYNNWRHLVMTFDNSTIKQYVDGVLVGTKNESGILDTCKGGQLKFGAWWVNQPSYLKGSLDDIGVWNRELTDDEIKSLYNANICYQKITVTDTLIINVGMTGFNPILYKNTIKVYPNPAKTNITIDNGDYNNINGYTVKIINSLGQQLFSNQINQPQFVIDVTNWGGNGLYFLHIIDSKGNIVDIRKIVIQ